MQDIYVNLNSYIYYILFLRAIIVFYVILRHFLINKIANHVLLFMIYHHYIISQYIKTKSCKFKQMQLIAAKVVFCFIRCRNRVMITYLFVLRQEAAKLLINAPISISIRAWNKEGSHPTINRSTS